MQTFRAVSVLSLLLCSLWLGAAMGCKAKIPEPEPAQPAPTRQTEPAPSVVAKAPAAPTAPKAGWSEVSVQNTLPLCAFASASERESARTVAQMKKQVFRGDQPVVFGVYAPSCINAKCEELATLQCSVERSGNTLRLQSRYLGFHKDGTSCRDQCEEATASCESPVLEPGEYKIEYGGAEIPLKIPSAVNMPCFKRS